MFTFWKLLVITVLVIAAAMILFWAIGFLAGVVWFVVKIVIVVVVLYLLVRWFTRKK